jgi:hypothetical protein
MAWDIILIKSARNTEPMEEINEKNTILFDSANVRNLLENRFSDIEIHSETWFHYEGGTYAISFNLAPEQIMLHVHILDEPEDAVETVIKELCALFDCRAFDTTAGEFW